MPQGSGGVSCSDGRETQNPLSSHERCIWTKPPPLCLLLGVFLPRSLLGGLTGTRYHQGLQVSSPATHAGCWGTGVSPAHQWGPPVLVLLVLPPGGSWAFLPGLWFS